MAGIQNYVFNSAVNSFAKTTTNVAKSTLAKSPKAAKAAADAFQKTIKSATPSSNTIVEFLKNIPSKLKALFSNKNMQAVKEFFVKAGTKIKDTIKNINLKPVKEFLTQAGTKIKAFANSTIIQPIKKLSTKIPGSAGSINWQQVGKTAGKGALIGAGVIAGFLLLKSIFGGNK